MSKFCLCNVLEQVVKFLGGQGSVFGVEMLLGQHF